MLFRSSAFWKGLMRVKDDFFSRGHFNVGNGMNTRFWEDVWLGHTPLSQQFPSLYNIVHRKQDTVANVFSNTTLNISFRRSLIGDKWDRWLELVQKLMHIQMSVEPDVFVWNLTTTGSFTVKSMYLDLLNGHTRYLRKYIWKMKVPLKIKIFMWFLHRRVILTKDNLVKRNWNGNKLCCFCDKEESIQHLFFECHLARIVWRIVHMTFNLAPPKNITNLFGNWLKGIPKKFLNLIRVGVCALLWALWNIRNDCVFNKQKNTSFLQVIPLATHWIRTWSYLQPVENRHAMDFGCNILETVAAGLFNQFGWRLPTRLTS